MGYLQNWDYKPSKKRDKPVDKLFYFKLFIFLATNTVLPGKPASCSSHASFQAENSGAMFLMELPTSFGLWQLIN
jgi:hypothetical protein